MKRTIVRSRRMALVVTAAGAGMAAFVHADVSFVDPDATGMDDGSSWSNAYTSLVVAIAAIGDGDQLWIKAGTYKPTAGADRTSSFMLDEVIALRGGFVGTETDAAARDIPANPTVLSGDLSGNDTSNFGNRSDNSRHVVQISVGEPTVTLDGLIVRGGNADGGSDPDAYGGGVLLLNYGLGERRLFAQTCRFEDNSANKAGGAIAGVLVTIELRGNPLDLSPAGMTVVSGNRSLNTSSIVLEGGGGVNVGRLVATRCRFAENVATGKSGGGLLLDVSASELPSSLVNVEFLDNVADATGGGAGLFNNTSLTNCLFARNEATADLDGDGLGGGFFVKAAEVVVTQCTVAENIANNDEAGGVGGGADNGSGGALWVRNSVFWDNVVNTGSGPTQSHAAQIGIYAGGNDASASPLAYCDVMNYTTCPLCPTPGPNYHNIGDDLNRHDPGFADPGGDDYRHLSAALTDTADDGSVPEDINDLDDDSDDGEELPLDLTLLPRVKDAHVDMGAYEWCLGDLNLDGVVEGADLGTVLANWGDCPEVGPCPGDLNGDGVVDGGDLGLVLAAYGSCPGQEEESLIGGSAIDEILSEYAFEDVMQLAAWLGTEDDETRCAVLSPLLP